jgi:dipeptidyl aminopeptidase/acylaminoacyl peptidase
MHTHGLCGLVDVLRHPVIPCAAGGSTGFGRAYRNRLRGSWGVVDVADVCAAAAHLAGQGLVDPQRLCIDGGSAGGYTTLAALAFRWDAGAL